MLEGDPLPSDEQLRAIALALVQQKFRGKSLFPMSDERRAWLIEIGAMDEKGNVLINLNVPTFKGDKR